MNQSNGSRTVTIKGDEVAARGYLAAFFRRYLRNDLSQSDYLLQSTGQQCAYPGSNPGSAAPRRLFDNLTALNVGVDVCSCIP